MLGPVWVRHLALPTPFPRAVPRRSPALSRLRAEQASPALLQRIVRRGYITSGGGVAPFASEVVAEVLTSGGQSRHLDTMSALLKGLCGTLCAELRRAGCFTFIQPSGGYFVWVQVLIGAIFRSPNAHIHPASMRPTPCTHAQHPTPNAQRLSAVAGQCDCVVSPARR